MSLPLQAVDRLFARLSATYGQQFGALYAGVEPGAVKTAWAHELAPWAGRLDAIAWALENLPDRCPNVIQFRNLCRMAPLPPEQQLPAPKADPERVAAELAKLGDVKRGVQAGSTDSKAWARRLIGRHEAGEKLNATVLLFARQALGLTRQAAPMRGEAV